MDDEYYPPVEEILSTPLPIYLDDETSDLPQPPSRREPFFRRHRAVYALIITMWLSGFAAGFLWYWIVALAKYVVSVL